MKKKAIILAFLSALLYALNTPFSKIMMKNVSSNMMGAFLYLGAGVGSVIVFYSLLKRHQEEKEKIEKADVPKLALIVGLDIGAIILIMLGVKMCNASTVSLLSNFEIVATSVIAHFFFNEKVRKKLWVAVFIITIASIVLSINPNDGFELSIGSLFVLIGTIMWGLENNITRKIAHKSASEIVMIKGFGTGIGVLIVALCAMEKFPTLLQIGMIMIVGFLVYGVSTFCFIRAQRHLGAARSSAYYATSPFIATLLSFAFLHEQISLFYIIGLALMIAGTTLTVIETLEVSKTTEDKINLA